MEPKIDASLPPEFLSIPFGVDQGGKLTEVARRRLPEFAGHFYAVNTWDWHPPRRFE
jgi:hypothetical protein